MVHRTTDRELDEMAKLASNCIEYSGNEITIGGSYGYTSIELKKRVESGVTILESGLTMGQAATWLRAFIEGCHYGKMGRPSDKWMWEEK